MNIICFGDSITEGAEFAPDVRWTGRLQQHLNAWCPEQFHVVNRGIGGNRVAILVDGVPLNNPPMAL